MRIIEQVVDVTRMSFEQGIETLVILAAGASTRFGASKQITLVPGLGKTFMELSIADAAAAGVNHVVIVVNASIRYEVENSILPRITSAVRVDLVEQSIADVRNKPWGTAHALLAAKEHVKGKFVVITADDYYGQHAFSDLQQQVSVSSDWHLLGYQLEQTLSDAGGVNRALCRLDDQQYLLVVEERLDIKVADTIDSDTYCSMTIWQLDDSIFESLQAGFGEFLSNRADLDDSEFCLADHLQYLITTEGRRIRMIAARDNWVGVTYAADLELVADKLAHIEDGFNVPAPLSNNQFHFEVLSPPFCEQDYEAVMSSKTRLRQIFGKDHPWPRDDMSFESNKQDLEQHLKEYESKEAFAYSVFNNATKDDYLGCVYIDPSKHPDYDCEVYLWVKDSAVDLDAPLFDAVEQWLQSSWPYQRRAYPGRTIGWDDWVS